LGLRRAVEIRFPAFIASRVECRSLAGALASSLPPFLRVAAFARWDSQVSVAWEGWKEELPPASFAVAQQTAVDAAHQSEQSALALTGAIPRRHAPPSTTRERLEQALLAAPGSEDIEHPSRGPGNLQTRLCNIANDGKVSRVQARLEANNDWPGVRLLADLCDSETDHSWLWMLATPTGDEVRGHEFCVAVRLRIGADVATFCQVRRCCGCPMDTRGLHALKCAVGEGTRGHNRVGGTLFDNCLAR
jgi:hypothetical protein